MKTEQIELTQADRDAARAYGMSDNDIEQDALAEAFARHRITSSLSQRDEILEDLRRRFSEIESIAKQAEIYAVGRMARLDPADRFAMIHVEAAKAVRAIDRLKSQSEDGE